MTRDEWNVRCTLIDDGLYIGEIGFRTYGDWLREIGVDTIVSILAANQSDRDARFPVPAGFTHTTFQFGDYDTVMPEAINTILASFGKKTLLHCVSGSKEGVMTFDDWLSKRCLSLDGWTDQVACRAIYDLLRAEKRPVNGLEIGTAGGRSLIAAAFALRDGPGGRIVGCDPFTVESAIEFEKEQEKIDWWKNRSTLQRSMAQCKREIATIANVSEWCELRVADAWKVADQFKDLTYWHLDGNHNEEAVRRDVDAFLPRCAPGCLIRLDDVNWDGVYGPTDVIRDCSDFVDSSGGQWEVWRKR